MVSEELFRDLKNKDESIRKIKDTPLSAKTVRDRTMKMAENVTSQQIKDLTLDSTLFSIAVDESCDTNDTAQLCLLGIYNTSAGPKEELIALTPLKSQTRGEDVTEAVIRWSAKHDRKTQRICKFI